MKVTSSYIFLNDVRFHAYHGVLPQEQEVGQDFLVSARAALDVAAAMEHDMVEVTLDYGVLYRIIKEEMAQTLNPPIGGDCEGAGVELHLER